VLNYRTVARQVGIEKMNSEVIKFAANYDLLIFCKANGISPETISKCSQITKTLWYMMDAKVHLEMDKTYFDMAAAARFNIVTTKEVADLLQSTGINNVTHILQGIDPKQFHPVDNVEKKYDVVFIGQKSKKRETIIGEIKAAGISVKCWGPGWSAEVYGEAFNRACAEGRILLAINNTDSSEDSFSDRMLRYMATGGCVVTEYSKGLEEHLEQTEGSLCKAYWPDKGESFGSLIKEILASPDAMKDMSKAGYEWVLEKHTWDKVSQKVLKIVAGGKI